MLRSVLILRICGPHTDDSDVWRKKCSSESLSTLHAACWWSANTAAFMYSSILIEHEPHAASSRTAHEWSRNVKIITYFCPISITDTGSHVARSGCGRLSSTSKQNGQGKNRRHKLGSSYEIASLVKYAVDVGIDWNLHTVPKYSIMHRVAYRKHNSSIIS